MHDSDGLARFRRLFMPTYQPLDRVFTRGEGVSLYDSQGRRYLDFCAGIAVNNLGHCHPAVVEAVREQAGRLMHISNLYIHEVELELAERLAGLAFPGRLFLCQSGAEANETAIKLARKYARTVLGSDRPTVISTLGSFHGRTLAALAATGQTKYQAGFEPIPEGFRHVPYGDAEAVARAIDGKTCAVLVEPLQGEGGVVVPPEGYLASLRGICDSSGVLLMLDEVQTGFGRTGTLFAYQREKIVPDVMTMAKAFGGGLPLGGALARPEVAAAFVPGNHATTFGGNPVTAAAAIAVLDVLEKENLAQRAETMGRLLVEGLRELAAAHPLLVTDIRGRGLLLGLELSRDAREAVSRCQERGLLITCVQERVLRFTPPLIIGEPEIREALSLLGDVLAGLGEEPAT